MDGPLGHDGQLPRRTSSSKTHIRSCSLSSAAAASAQLVQRFGKCLQMSPVQASATMSAPPLGTSQVWKAEQRRGWLIFYTSLHEAKLCEERTPL